MNRNNRGSIAGALMAAALFGASTPAAKAMGAELHPFALAGLLYAGSGIGLSAWLLARLLSGRRVMLGIAKCDLPWLAGAILTGGVVAPALLMFGLARTDASIASLLLNLESVFTALIAWFVFRESFDRRIAAGMALIVAGGVLLAAQPDALLEVGLSALLVAGACLCWAIDNNLTRRISAGDATAIAAIKGCVAGASNLTLAVAAGAAWPTPGVAISDLCVGLAGYGFSLVLFVIALRELGSARTGAYFSTAPFFGVGLSIAVLGEKAGPQFWAAAALMAWGVWLHVSERHSHPHAHETLEHGHSHVHDAHHRHMHDFDWDGTEPHIHSHRHPFLTHTHPHFPDIHHRHVH